MKHLLSFLMVFVLLVPLAGCAQQPPQPKPLPETTGVATKDEPTTTTEPPSTTVRPTETTMLTSTTPTNTLDTTVATLPLPTTAPVITPPAGDVSICSHNYQPGIYQTPTCEQAGFQNYRCPKCGDVQQQISQPLGHTYEDATCITPKRCILCSSTHGSSLGHCVFPGDAQHDTRHLHGAAHGDRFRSV